ncbi:hypothetical protein [Streptomyces sp. NPDC056632]|uniref:hypothetical protein n=1 Tax=Streptomyces sp. NPDC056632 TaxID=3345884 RepID=UPI003699507C
MRRSVTMVVRTGTVLSSATRRRPIRADITLLTAAESRNRVYDLVGIKDLLSET